MKKVLIGLGVIALSLMAENAMGQNGYGVRTGKASYTGYQNGNGRVSCDNLSVKCTSYNPNSNHLIVHYPHGDVHYGHVSLNVPLPEIPGKRITEVEVMNGIAYVYED